MLCCALPCQAGEEKKKPDGKGILIEIRLSSEVDGNTVKMTPKVVTMEGKAAKITVGDRKTLLNDHEVKSDKAMKEGKNFYTTLDITPTLIESTNPEGIKLEMKFYLNHNNCEVSENFSTVIIGNEPFKWEYVDPARKQKVGLTVNASVSKDKQEKVKVDVETK